MDNHSPNDAVEKGIKVYEDDPKVPVNVPTLHQNAISANKGPE
jgi:hypothetical protein